MVAIISNNINININININNNNVNNNRTASRKRRRGHGLFGLVCVSLCAGSSTGYVNPMHSSMHSSSRRQHQSQSPQQQSPSAISVISSTSAFWELEGGNNNNNNNSKQIKRKKSPARLTPKEESELLRRAVEYRRLNELEKDMALMTNHHNHNHNHNTLPLLSVRAKAAGYGEQLDEYEDAMYEGQIARETLVTHNMGLVHYCVNQIIGKDFSNNNNNNDKKQVTSNSNSNSNINSNKGLPLNSLSREDLIQEGCIGLARAVDKWNPEIGGKFSTYAVYWCRAAILRCIAERDDVVRVPNHVSQAVLQINKAAKRLGWELQESGGILVTEDSRSGSSGSGSSRSSRSLAKTNNSPQWKAANAAKRLAEEAGLSERNFEEAMKVRRRRYSGGYVPFESWMQKTSKSSTGSFQHSSSQSHSDENEDHDRQRLESSVANEEIRTVLSKHLRPKEMEALSWRYGLLQEEEEQAAAAAAAATAADESIADRANRQFLEMEDQLFGSVVATATATSTVATSTTAAAAVSVVKRKAVKPAFTSTATATATAPPAKGRFGEAMTFTEVGKKMQVSAEHTRRLCHKALNKLQQAAEDGTLEPAFLC